ncbi:uncharacterized protein [Palaemon carinicauda]|uniref:uncharacterized protein n=1 Tax=Palaemon carinicauda TaxID=392227 RepID=UPI0035B65017
MTDVIRAMDAARTIPVSDSHQDSPAGVVNRQGVSQGSRLWPKEASDRVEDQSRFLECWYSNRKIEGSVLSPFLYALVMEVLSEDIRKDDLWEFLYEKDLVITAENEEDLQRRVVEWQGSLERGGLKVNVHKTEVMVSSKEDRGQDSHT